MQHVAIGPELQWLAVITLFTGLLWMPYVIDRIVEHGLWPALRNPERDARPRAAWADRLMAAHANAVENLVVFAPLALGVQVTGSGDAATAAASAIYVAARVAHAIIYTAGVPVLRTVAFLVGFGCQATLALRLLGAV